MALRIRFLGPTGSTLAFSIERLADGETYDFSTSAFTAGTPTTPVQSLLEVSGFPGKYAATIASTPTGQFPDGAYLITVVDQVANLSVGLAQSNMFGGDDEPLPPNVATVSGPVTVGGFSDGVTLPITSHDLALKYGGAVVADDESVTFFDPDTDTPRVKYGTVATPGGRTVTLY